MIDDIEHPENISNSILGGKLNSNSINPTVVSDHSLPKMGTVSPEVTQISK
jgi:hypothetical protein